MGSNIKDELIRTGVVPAPAPAPAPAKKPAPACYIQQVFDAFKRRMQDAAIKTPLEEITLLADNFPYLIKLQWHDPAAKKWRNADPKKVLPLLEAGTFDEKGYRLEDPRRARVLPHLPTLLSDPDEIYVNCGGVRGKYVYVKKHKGEIKVAFTIADPRLKTVVVVSSFKTSQRWLSKHGKHPPIYVRGQKPKATS